jgi:predicted glycosyltransferase
LRILNQSSKGDEMNETILFHGPNRVGIGHMNRIASIANALRETHAGFRPIAFIEGISPTLETHNIPYVSLLRDETLYTTETWEKWDLVDRVQMQVKLCQATIHAIHPHAIVVDCFATLACTIAIVESDVPVVLCMREMANLSKYIEAMKRIIGRAETILIPHDSGQFDLPCEIREKCEFVGEIVQPHMMKLRPQHGEDGKRIVITGGGGGCPGTLEFYNLSMAAAAGLRQTEPEIKVDLVLGPQFTEWQALRVPEGVQLIPYEKNMAARMSKASIVVCQAGYNTIAELRHINVRVVCLPAPRPADDQFARAYAFQRESPNVCVVTTTEVRELTDILLKSIEKPLSSHRQVVANGAYGAADKLASIVNKRRSPIAAAPLVFSREDLTRRMNEYKTMLQTLYQRDQPGAAITNYLAASPFR